jgi:hypothetical protein
MLMHELDTHARFATPWCGDDEKILRHEAEILRLAFLLPFP